MPLTSDYPAIRLTDTHHLCISRYSWFRSSGLKQTRNQAVATQRLQGGLHAIRPTSRRQGSGTIAWPLSVLTSLNSAPCLKLHQTMESGRPQGSFLIVGLGIGLEPGCPRQVRRPRHRSNPRNNTFNINNADWKRDITYSSGLSWIIS
jgi:hypothetical protein